MLPLTTHGLKILNRALRLPLCSSSTDQSFYSSKIFWQNTKFDSTLFFSGEFTNNKNIIFCYIDHFHKELEYKQESGTKTEGEKQQQEISKFQVRPGTRISPKAVSYTHLDVYKRQITVLGHYVLLQYIPNSFFFIHKSFFKIRQ